MKDCNYCLLFILLELIFFFALSLIPLVVIGVPIDCFSFFMIFGYSIGITILIKEFIIDVIIEEFKENE